MVVNYTMDICKYLDGSLSNKILDIFAKDLKKYSNFIRPCPHSVSDTIFLWKRASFLIFFNTYKGHFYLRNMTFNDENFPPIVPSAEAYMDFQYFMHADGKVKLMHYLRPYVEVKTKGIFYFWR